MSIKGSAVVKKIVDSLNELGWAAFDGMDPITRLAATPHTFFIHKKHNNSGEYDIGLHVIFSPRFPNKIVINKCLILNPIANNVVVGLPKYLSREVIVTGSDVKKIIADEIIILLSNRKPLDEYITQLKETKLNSKEVERLGKILLRNRFFNNAFYNSMQLDRSIGSQVFFHSKIVPNSTDRSLYELIINVSENFLNITQCLKLEFVIIEDGKYIDKSLDRVLNSPERRKHLINNIGILVNEFIIENKSSAINYREFHF